MSQSKKSWVPLAIAIIIAAGGGITWWAFNGDQVGDHPETITIGSFNIYEFGKGSHPQHRDIGALAKLLMGMDLVVLQEVGAQGGAAQVLALRDSMNAALPPGSKTFKQPLITNETGNSECYAFIYRDPVTYIAAEKNPQSQGGEWWISPDPNSDGIYDDDVVFDRVPAYMYFRAKNFDFVIATAHLMWTDLAQREMEVDTLREWLWTFDPSGSEEDIVLVGDMNRYGNYTGTSVDDMAFSRFLINEWQNHYRILFLEPLPTLTTKYAGRDEESTTVGGDRNLYDQIFISTHTTYEFGAAKAKYGETIGVIPFDMVPPYDTMNHNTLKVTMSDHRPVWARFRIDQPDDDRSV